MRSIKLEGKKSIQKNRQNRSKIMINIIAFMGPSGAGKSTLQEILGYERIITWTSRTPREGEVDGKDYHFGDKDRIIQLYNEGLMLEYTEYNGNVYGTGLESIEELIGSKYCRSIVVDENGARKLKEKFLDHVLVIGVIAPYEECKSRLMDREDKNIEKRLFTYSHEVSALMELSDVIVNNSKANWGKATLIMEMIKKKS